MWLKLGQFLQVHFMGLDEIFFWKWNDLGTETLFKSEKAKISLKKLKSAQRIKKIIRK